MVCLRFLSLLLVLLLSLAALEGYIASTHQGVEVLANSNHYAIVANKEIQMKQEVEGMKRSKQMRLIIRGRKMGGEDDVMKGRMLMKKGGNKCENVSEGMKGKLNIECELRVGSRSPPSSGVQLVGLIPFSSDYHAPKTHPPKNN